jgi:NitT/TauT family transport system permease protein
MAGRWIERALRRQAAARAAGAEIRRRRRAHRSRHRLADRILFFPAFPVPAASGDRGTSRRDLRRRQDSLDAFATFGRILLGLAGAFVLGAIFAFLMGRSEVFQRYAYPLLNFNQGIPALSWVVVSIIWFRGVEFRIFFIMVMTTLPAFSFQLLDAYRAMSKDLLEMTLSFRPSRLDLLRVLVLPTVLPGILTAWKVNLGNAARVVVVAELVGATGGVGYELLQQQQLFDMAGAIAWTIVLVIFVLVMQRIIGLVEGYFLRWRPAAERGV